MDDIEQEIQKYEQGLTATFKNKIKTMEALLANKDDQLSQAKQQLDELRSQFDHNLLVVKERDDDLRDIEHQFQKSIELSKEKAMQHDKDRLAWQDRSERLEREVVSRNTEIKDLIEKLKEAKREMGYYKKGYLDEVAMYKDTIDKKNEDLEALKAEVQRVKREEMAAVEARFETIMKENKENYTRMIDEANQKAQCQRDTDQAIMQDKDNQITSLRTEIERLQSRLSAVSNDVTSRQQAIDTATSRLQTALDDSHRKEVANAARLAVLEDKLATADSDRLAVGRQLKSCKVKAVDRLREMEEDWRVKVEAMVVEYRAEIEGKSRELKRTTEDYRSCREELKRLTDKLAEAERQTKATADELDILIREKDRETSEEMHALKNKLEVATYREHDAISKAEKLEERNKKLNDDLGKERVKGLDLEKETQILVEQVINLKEALKRSILQVKGHGNGSSGGNDQVYEPSKNKHSNMNIEDKRKGEDPVELRSSNDPLDDLDVQIPSNLLDSRLAKVSQLLRSQDYLIRSHKRSRNSSPERDTDTANENEELHYMIATLKEEMMNAQQQVDTAFKANDALKGKYNDLLEKYEDASAEAMDAKEKLIDARTQLSNVHINAQQSHAHVDQVRAEKNQIQQELRDLKIKYEEKEANFRDLQAQLEEEIESLTVERDELIRTLSRAKSKLNRLEDSVGRKDTSKLDIYLAEIDRLMIERESMAEQLMSKNLEIERLRKNLDNQLHRKPVKRDTTREKQMSSKVEPDNKKKIVRNYNVRDDDDFANNPN